MLKVYEVTYFDEYKGCEGSIMVKASSEYDAIERVERLGEYEVLDVQFVDFYDEADQ
jgi:hypothetical protein